MIMQVCSLILFVGICSSPWAVADIPTFKYNIEDDGTLTQISSQDELFGVVLDGLGIKRIQGNVFDNHSSLLALSIVYNQLTELPPLIFSKLKNLWYLDLSNNNLREFDRSFVGLNKLDILKLANNSINSLRNGDFFGLPRSTIIVIEGNNISSLTSDIFSEPSTSIGSHSDQTNPQPKSLLQNANILEFSNLKICKTNDGILESVDELIHSKGAGNCLRKTIDKRERQLDLSGLGLRKFQRGWYQISEHRFDELNLSNNNITEITPELLNDLPRHVRIINLERNYIRIIKKNIMKNRYIRRLFLGHNSISMIENDAFKFTDYLFHLSISNNNLESLIFTETLPKDIIRLDLHNNGISEIHEDLLINLKNLVSLSIQNNCIDKLPVNTFRQLRELEKLNISSNRLTSIESRTFLNQNKLVYLDLSYNKISEINADVFKGLRMLHSINLNNNNIQKVATNSFSELDKTNIMNINLASNRIDTIEKDSFANMIISDLVLSKNKIGDESIAPFAFNGAHISRLYLSNNLMTNLNNLPYVNVSSLTELSLDKNKIIRVKPFATVSLGTLRKLDLSGNTLFYFAKRALCGLRKDIGVTIIFNEVNIKTIHSGMFDCS